MSRSLQSLLNDFFLHIIVMCSLVLLCLCGFLLCLLRILLLDFYFVKKEVPYGNFWEILIKITTRNKVECIMCRSYENFPPPKTRLSSEIKYFENFSIVAFLMS